MNIQEFDFSINMLSAILWQYNKAINIQSIIQLEQEFYNINHTQFWQKWYDDVFNLQTANNFGLAVWSIILQLPIQLSPPQPIDQQIWGFGQYRKNFTRGNFAISGSSAGLTTEEKRIVLKLRYYQLVANGAIPNTNKFLNFVFKDMGGCYVIDNLDMSITCAFGFEINQVLLEFIKKYDLIPRCSGVKIKYIYANQDIWGFGQYRKNFNNGNFSGEL